MTPKQLHTVTNWILSISSDAAKKYHNLLQSNKVKWMDHEKDVYEEPTLDDIRNLIDGLARQAEEGYYNNDRPALFKVAKHDFSLTIGSNDSGCFGSLSYSYSFDKSWGLKRIPREDELEGWDEEEDEEDEDAEPDFT